jgi:hypothetical protein
MSSNRKLGLEEVIVDKDLYLFKADFKFLQSLKENSSVDPMKMYESFSASEYDLDSIVDILSFSVISINKKPIANPKEVIEDLISRFGLQQCWMLCYTLLSDAMIGDVKKSELKLDEKIQQLRRSNNFLLTSLKKQPFSWVYQVWIFGICLWGSFNLINPLFT